MRSSIVHIIMLVFLQSQPITSIIIPISEEPEMNKGVESVISSVLSDQCFPLLLIDNSNMLINSPKDIGEIGAVFGAAVFELEFEGQDGNMTQAQFSQVIKQARWLRQMSWCMVVMVVSDNIEFLNTFAQWSLKGRLLVWSTKLLVVTGLPMDDIEGLLKSHWTFSMMNTMVLHINQLTQRFGLFSYFPYTRSGGKVVQVAYWTPARGLIYFTGFNVFMEKYHNFYGGNLNVTAQPFEPYWMIRQVDNKTEYYGMDYNQLEALSRSLNFTINVVPTTNWGEVTAFVEKRISFIASVMYGILYKRLERFEFTYSFDSSNLGFALAKPIQKPNWLSFYYPIGDFVWAGVFITTIAICLALIMITKSDIWKKEHGQTSSGAVILETVGTLLGQGLHESRSTSLSNYTLVGLWLMFCVVVGTGYRGGLIASLTVPRLPPRPETLDQLVKAVDRATFGYFGHSFKAAYSSSNNSAFRKLVSIMDIGFNGKQGLTDGLTTKTAHVASRLYLELTVAQEFTRADGSNPVYVAKDSIVPATAAWPIPHDAPYKAILDHKLIALTEAGLYLQWRKEVLEMAARDKRIRQRDKIARGEIPEIQTNDDERPLTITHVQGPLLLYLVGIIMSMIAFGVENIILVSRKAANKNKD